MKSEPITLSLDDRRLLGIWTADCAERALTLFEAKAPSDPRPREAIEGIRVFARGGKRTVQLRSLALAALAAGREAGDPSASAAAQAAGFAAATPTFTLATGFFIRYILSVCGRPSMQYATRQESRRAHRAWWRAFFPARQCMTHCPSA